MEHIVVLIGQIVDFSTLHPLQLTVVDGSETVSDGDDERYGIQCGWRLRTASFGFRSACQTRRNLGAADASKCFSSSCSYDISGLKKRYAVDKINCRQTPVRLPSRNCWWVVILLLSA